MEKFDFDHITERRGSGSMKWDLDKDPEVIPLWVADMDFRTAPAVTEALLNRIKTGIFGYTDVPDAYYNALTDWFKSRHGWDIDKNDVIYTTGIVPAISAVIKALTIPGDGVILQLPAYNCFFSSIRNNGCRQIDNSLLREETAGGFTYSMDFEGLRKAASDPRNKLLILCNPHNPTGRVWTLEELETVKDICRENRVTVVSDEIHCELVHDGRKYVPYATIDENAIICVSPSKAFNTAGLQIANIVCRSEDVRGKIDRAINDNEVCDVNPFGVAGLMAAYSKGGDWLDALNRYLDDNYSFLKRYIEANIPRMNVCESEATYLAWIDVAGLGLTGDEAEELFLSKSKVRISSGATYGDGRYIRLNYACQRSRLEEALRRMSQTIKENLN